MRLLGRFSCEQRLSYAHLLQWTAIAAVTGLIGAVLVAGFRWIVDVGVLNIERLAAPPPLVALGAALLTGLVVYRVAPDAAGEGIPSYLYAMNREDGRMPPAVTVWKLPAAAFSLLGFGSGGLVGPLGRVSAGVASSLVGRITRRPGDEPATPNRSRRTAAICGLSAVVSALFGVPVGAGIFAVEIIQKANMHYSDLFPSILSAAVASWVSLALGWTPIVPLLRLPSSVPAAIMPWVVLLSIVVAVLAGLFTGAYGLTVRVFKRDRGRVALKVVVGTVSASLLVWLVNPALFGGALGVVHGVLQGELEILYGALSPSVSLALVVVVALVVRLVATCLTIGSGMSAGLLGPAALIGLLAGVFASVVIGVEPGSAGYYALLAAGFAGMLAGVMNVPIAASVMTVEVFGLAFGLPAGLAAVVGFQMNRHRTIYDTALVGSGHLEEHALR